MSEREEQNRNIGLDYGLCGVDGTRLHIRGPLPDMDAPYVSVLGGTETFGKYVAHPFPALLQDWIDTPVLNLGVQQAGLSLFSEERWLLETSSKADLTVLQVLGAQNMSNRLYHVHSRRNDRFLGVSPALRDMFPGVDFTEINFTGHLLETLLSQSRAAFDALVDELKWSWTQRMRRIVQSIDGPILLLWISDRRPEETQNSLSEGEPHFVDRAMLDEFASETCGVVQVIRDATSPLDGKVVPEGEEDAAELLPCPADHARIAEALVPKVREVLEGPGAAVRTRAKA